MPEHTIPVTYSTTACNPAYSESTYPEPHVDQTVLVFAVVLEEKTPYPPYGDGSVIRNEIRSVYRHHASAQDALQAEREEAAKYLSDRFRVYMKSERLPEELARKVPA